MKFPSRIKPIAAMLGMIALPLATSSAHALTTTCDLTALNSTCQFSTDSTSGQAIYTNPDNTSKVGSGVIDPFLTLQAPTGEDPQNDSGYSTDASALPLDDKRDNGNNQFTRTFSLNQVGFFTIGSIQYYGFFLDVNEPNGDKSLISLDYVKLFDTKQTSNVLLDTDSLSAPDNQVGWNLVYNLDANADNSVLLDYDLFNGSGNGYDMELLIPVSAFAGVALDSRIVFATAFSQEGDGFEEWAHLAGTGVEVCPPGTIGTPPDNCALPPVTVPEPGELSLLGLGLVSLVAIRRRQPRRSPSA